MLSFSHSHVQPSGQKRAVWNVKCSCGVEKQMSTGTLCHGTTISCGHIGREERAKARRLPDGEAAKNSLFLAYKHSAKCRGIAFNVSKEEFYSYAVGACHYCGDVNPQIHKGKCRTGFNYCGIDRIDSSRGYETGNMVTCCGTCNMMKNAMPQEVFLGHIEKVYNCAVKTRKIKEDDQQEYC
ncbi:hypothetical protein [Pseudomonas phage PSA11]|uniref:hypothetical protein ORF032 n=1 Tax=Pseudomonas phage PA11 TaxID=347327 RepID=UPI0001554370|nr:hypothetical protein ORF032 [Pseudomonas phage PA11]QVJ12735.1 hypothetical protein [Pseudomonas phage PSA11]